MMALGIEIGFEEWIWWRWSECNKRNSVYFDWCNYCGHILTGEEKFNVKMQKRAQQAQQNPKRNY